MSDAASVGREARAAIFAKMLSYGQQCEEARKAVESDGVPRTVTLDLNDELDAYAAAIRAECRAVVEAERGKSHRPWGTAYHIGHNAAIDASLAALDRLAP